MQDCLRGTPDSTPPTATYVYDGEGRRVIKTTYGAGGKTTYYFYDPTGLLLTEVIPTAETATDYIYLNGTPLARVDWSPGEQDLVDEQQVVGNYLKCSKPSAGTVRLDWSTFPFPTLPGNPADDNKYIVRRKTQPEPPQRNFNNNVVIATVEGSRTFDDSSSLPPPSRRFDYSISRRTFSNILNFYHTDHLGTPIAMTSFPSGQLVWRAEHRPFGDLMQPLTVALVENNLRFSGHYFDTETGLHHNWYRTYSSNVARYFQSDPVGVLAGTNVYVYANDDSLNQTDPVGLYVSPVHYSATLFAELINGSSFTTAHSIALESVLEDFLPNSQGTDPMDTHRHAMGGFVPGRGLDYVPGTGANVTDRYETCEEAKRGTQQFIEESIQKAQSTPELYARGWGAAYHASQDSWAGGHGYQPWLGGIFRGTPLERLPIIGALPSHIHLLLDIPSPIEYVNLLLQSAMVRHGGGLAP